MITFSSLLFFLMIRRHPISKLTATLFPYTTLFRSSRSMSATVTPRPKAVILMRPRSSGVTSMVSRAVNASPSAPRNDEFDRADITWSDRKSTRRTPVTNAHLVCRLLLEKKKKEKQYDNSKVTVGCYVDN